VLTSTIIGSNTNGTDRAFLRIVGSGEIQVGLGDLLVETIETYNDGAEHTARLISDGTNYTLTVDNILVLSGTHGGTLDPNKDFHIGSNAGSSQFFNGTISNPTINGTRFPLAEGAGSTAYSKDGTNHATLVGNPTWVREDGIPSSNLNDGFSLYEHASLDPLRVPYGDDGQPLTITPPTGYTKTSDNPAVSNGPHNDAETELDFYNIATDGGTTPAVLASGVAITDYTFGDSVSNPLFKRSISSVLEDRQTLFAAVLTGDCLETANEYTQ